MWNIDTIPYLLPTVNNPNSYSSPVKIKLENSYSFKQDSASQIKIPKVEEKVTFTALLPNKYRQTTADKQ